jgi:DNA-binding response OmpR family regulator
VRILVVEDNRRMAASIKKALVEEAYAVDLAYDGEEGQQLAESITYDLIILDIILPKKDGIEVCRSLRRRKVASRILMLTQKRELADRVQGLDSGADDYLAKPFDTEELSARVRALLRRDVTGGSTVLRVGDVTLNTITRRVGRGDRDIDLEPREYAILHYLMTHADMLVTRAMIEEHVWDMSLEAGSHLLDVYISRLRKKLGDGEHPIIETERGVGFRMSRSE